MMVFDLKHWWNFGSKLSKTTNNSKFSSAENRDQSTANNIDPKLQLRNFRSSTEKQKENNMKSILDSNMFDATTIEDNDEYHGIL